MTITVLYSCVECGISKRGVAIPERGDESVIDWMTVVAFNIGVDHENYSPKCCATKISEIMIPISGANKVGGPAVN